MAHTSIRIGHCLLLPHLRQVLVDGDVVRLGGRAFDLLVALAERRNRVVGKDELYELIWPGLAVEPNNLEVQIWSLRRLIGPDAIKTVPRRGYQLTPPVEFLSAAAPQGPTAPLAPAQWPSGMVADELARQLAQVPWLTLTGRDATVRRALADAVARTYASRLNVTVWDWQPPAHAALLAPPAAIVRRLRQIGGLLLLPEATPMQRVAMVGWLGQAPAGNTLRMLVTAPAARPLAGEQVLTLPGAQAAPQVRAGSRRRGAGAPVWH